MLLCLSGIHLSQVNAALLRRCSSGFDRYREEWLSYGCGQEVRPRVTSLRSSVSNDAELPKELWASPGSENSLSAPLWPMLFWNRLNIPLDSPFPLQQDRWSTYRRVSLLGQLKGGPSHPALPVLALLVSCFCAGWCWHSVTMQRPP